MRVQPFTGVSSRYRSKVRPQTPIKERKVPKQQIIKTAPSAMPSSDKANATLDRIEIPHDAIQQISELLIPGSSLIISDYGISSETGPYTVKVSGVKM